MGDVVEFPLREMLPLVPYYTLCGTLYLSPNHPAVKGTPAGVAVQREWDRINKLASTPRGML